MCGGLSASKPNYDGIGHTFQVRIIAGTSGKHF